MEILNVGVGVIDSKNRISVYSISKPSNLNERSSLKIEDEIQDTLVNKDVDVSHYMEYSEEALIAEDSFYLSLNSLDSKNQFYYIKEGLLKDKLLVNAEQIGLRRKDIERLINKKERIKFLIIENQNNFYFCNINQRTQIIKNKKGISIGSLENRFSIEYGIVFPEYISAVLDKSTNFLSIVSVKDFERMFNLKVVRFTQAEAILEKFKSQEYSVGKDNIKVKFSKDVSIYKKEYGKTRQITYLSGYNQSSSNYSTDSINNAMSHLKSTERIKISEGVMTIENPSQFKTFVAILHDSIVHRILSDTYES